MPSLLDKLFNRKSKATADSDSFPSIYQRATTAYANHDFQGAVPLYEQALLLDPSHAEAHYRLGNALKNVGRLEVAIQSYDRAVSFKPDYSHAYCNRGAIQHSLGMTREALSSYERAIALDPADSKAHYNRALLLQELERWEEAVESYEHSITLEPEFADAHYNRAVALLFLGDFTRGWQEYEWRWKNAGRLGIGEARDFHRAQWTGAESLDGKKIFLHSEAGLGDTIQFSRYAALVAARGAIVHLEVQPPLVTLMGTIDGGVRVTPKGASFPDFDYHCPLMSLPLAFKTTRETIPATPGYLRSDPAKVASWTSKLGARGAPRIGLAWSGNPKNPIDQRRTARLSEWLPFLPREYSFFCVQKGIRQEDAAALAMNPFIQTFDDELVDFSDTAALCECMDLVVTVDTSVAHLSAALGRPTWVLLASVPDWRWFRDGEDTPWYPTAVLYRQKAVGNWAGVFERIASDLRERFPSR